MEKMPNNGISLAACRAAGRPLLQYAVGPLLYAPAARAHIAREICRKKYPDVRALALCLEDAVADRGLPAAEKALAAVLRQIDGDVQSGRLAAADLPLLFVRIRTPEYLAYFYDLIEDAAGILTGFVLPKYDLTNAAAYGAVVRRINAKRRERPLYIMPILESAALMVPPGRAANLAAVKRALDEVRPYVLNVRIGGNDFCNLYGFRRDQTQTIYDIAALNAVLADISLLFSRDYVVAAPVWEYFADGRDDRWRQGLERELRLDRLNGFIGKTAIHPSQASVILKSLRVDELDYQDAARILNWRDDVLGVAKSAGGQRMNELKVHAAWARRVLLLARIYGVGPAE